MCWCRGSGCSSHGDVGLLNGGRDVTHSTAHSAHQGAAKNLAKCEFVLGLALLMTETLGNAHLPHTEERIGELMLYTELMRACMRAAEADAELDEWGVMCPAPLPAESDAQSNHDRLSANGGNPAAARLVELLLILPSEEDFRARWRRRSSSIWRPTSRRARPGQAVPPGVGRRRAVRSAAVRCCTSGFSPATH